MWPPENVQPKNGRGWLGCWHALGSTKPALWWHWVIMSSTPLGCSCEGRRTDLLDVVLFFRWPAEVRTAWAFLLNFAASCFNRGKLRVDSRSMGKPAKEKLGSVEVDCR